MMKAIMGDPEIRKKKREDFREWIKQFDGWESPIGDLAEDVIKDSESAQKPREYFLNKIDGDDEVLEIFNLAWTMFESKRFIK